MCLMIDAEATRMVSCAKPAGQISHRSSFFILESTSHNAFSTTSENYDSILT